jgi:hypothetical protein
MNPGRCCPYCLEAASRCPHSLICAGKPGEIFDGALAERLRQLWLIIMVSVGDDPVVDERGVYAETWHHMLGRFSAEADLTIEGNGSTAIFVENAGAMASVVEHCIPADEL